MDVIENKTVLQEISSILNAELVCAESLQATAVEIQSLNDRAQFEQIHERLFSRNQILDTMVSLDEKLADLVKLNRDQINDSEWAELQQLGLEIKRLLDSILCTGRGFQQNIKSLCDDISTKIVDYSQGRKGLDGYHKNENRVSRGRG